jgi:hypothetical protein
MAILLLAEVGDYPEKHPSRTVLVEALRGIVGACPRRPGVWLLPPNGRVDACGLLRVRLAKLKLHVNQDSHGFYLLASKGTQISFDKVQRRYLTSTGTGTQSNGIRRIPI